MQKNITRNILLAGIGGQGTILASKIICPVLFKAGFDLKKSEVHGMSQRGGSVKSDIRFGDKVYSPLIPDGKVDFLVAFHPTELDRNRVFLSKDGVVIEVEQGDEDFIPHAKMKNLFLVGKLSCHLPVGREIWEEVIKEKVPAVWLEKNMLAFHNGIEREGKK